MSRLLHRETGWGVSEWNTGAGQKVQKRVAVILQPQISEAKT